MLLHRLGKGSGMEKSNELEPHVTYCAKCGLLIVVYCHPRHFSHLEQFDWFCEKCSWTMPPQADEGTH